MALQGNPFLGKLKIPAPDLSRIPETPFESKTLKPAEPPLMPAPLPSEAPRTDRVQTGSELGFNGAQDRVQTGSELGFNGAQNQVRNPSPKKLNPFEPVLDRVQTGSVTGSNSSPKLPAYGEIAVLRYFADREHSPGEVVSTRRREIAVGTAQTLNGVKTALRRLREARLIELHDFARGPNRGITSYRLTSTARELLGSKSSIERLGFNRVQTGSVTGSNGFSSSSSSLKVEDLKTTTTGESELFDDGRLQLAPEWAGVDFATLTDMGFSRAHLIQLARHDKLSPTEVQDSIHFFAFDLKRNEKGREIKGSPLNFFMGILRKGLPYAPPENYESPEQEARRRYLDGKRRIEEQRLAEEREIMGLEFTEWRRGLSDDQVMAMTPEAVRDIRPAREAALKIHFENEVWPDRRAAIPGAADERAEIRKQIDEYLGGGATFGGEAGG